jgi:GT2 family glycosyltransferase
MTSTPVGVGAPRVSAVIVSHDGERWIPHLVSALEASTCIPDAVVAVDTGSSDGSRSLLGAAVGREQVVEAPRGIGFGEAVRQGVEALDARGTSGARGSGDNDNDNDWLWLLHDDCAPAPDALEQLLLLVREYPDVAVVGCRVRAWPRARRLLEVGVTMTGTGRRETGLEPGEYDQGQHDGVRHVLAVSSAGMLVRRSVWDELGGFDPRLALFRDDVDFGWRAAHAGRKVVVSPDAVVFHAEAATRGVRPIDNTLVSPHRADRAAALYTLLVNCSLLALPVQYARLAIGSVLRALGFLAGKLPSAAYDEIAAAARVLSRPDLIVSGRARRRRTRTASRSEVRALLPGWWTPYANGLDALLSRFAETFRDSAAAVADSAARTLRRRGSDVNAIETGPVDDDAADVPWGAGPVAWVARHPVLSLSGALAALALVADRGLFGAGLLQGGALLPPPDGASGWWGLYTEQWHPVALGSSDAASPYAAVLGTLGAVLLGKAWLAVDVLMLMAVPLAAWGAFSLARRIFASRAVQSWAALSYALLPVVTGAFASGRLGTVVAAIVLPWLVRLALPLFTASAAPWRAAFGAGLVLAVMSAFCPIAWVVAAAAAAPGAVLLAIRRRPLALVGLIVTLAVPLIVLMPWSFRVLSHPSLLLTEAGAIDPSTAALGGQAWQALFGRLSAAGDAPWWIGVGIVVAALAALVRTDRWAGIAAAWTVAGASLAVAALAGGHTVSAAGSSLHSPAWLGFPVIVAQAAFIGAGAIAADGAREFIQSGRFGWRQPVALLTSVVAIAAPLAGLVWWVGAASHGELVRTSDSTLPAYIVDQLRSGDQQRVLLLTGNTDHVSYDVIMDDGVRLGDDSVDPLYGDEALDALVADVVSEGRGDDADRLADFGIGYIMIPAPADAGLVAAFDGLPGLTKASTDPGRVVGWQFDQPTGFARLHDPADRRSGETLSTSSGSGSADIASGAGGRTLDLAAPEDQAFAASLDGARLPSQTSAGGVQFEVGPDSGRIEFGPTGHRLWWLALQAVAIVICVVFAAPAARRRQGIAEAIE